MFVSIEMWSQFSGGLRTDGFVVGSFSDHGRIILRSAARCK